MFGDRRRCGTFGCNWYFLKTWRSIWSRFFASSIDGKIEALGEAEGAG